MRSPISKRSRVFRVELELRSRFLRHYKIKDPYDFGKLVGILPKRHIHFARFNEKRLVARLRGMRFSARRVAEILDDVRLLEGDAWATLNYLRRELALKSPVSATVKHGERLDLIQRRRRFFRAPPHFSEIADAKIDVERSLQFAP